MELEDIMHEAIEIAEGNFYSKKFYFSYSSLNKLAWNPVVFHQLYILGIKEEKQEAHLVHGKIIHGLLLEPEKFQEQFIISPDNLPSGNARLVVDRVFAHHQELSKNGDDRIQLHEFSDAILDVMKDMNYHQSLKTDQQRLDKILTNEMAGYWNFLRTKGSKTLIDQQSYDYCFNAVELIKQNKEVCNLIACNLTEFDNKEVFNELPLSIDLPNRPFGLKGIVDNLVIDHDRKIVYINDIKTTSKDLKDFPETVEFYSYWMQAVIYATLITVNFGHLFENGYSLKFNFVVIDKMFQVYPFEVTESTLSSWLTRLNTELDKAQWHYQNKKYDLPYEFATGSIKL